MDIRVCKCIIKNCGGCLSGRGHKRMDWRLQQALGQENANLESHLVALDLIIKIIHSSVRSLASLAAAVLESLLPVALAESACGAAAPAANSCSWALYFASTLAVKFACSSSKAGHSAMMRRAACSFGSLVFGLLHRSMVRACTQHSNQGRKVVKYVQSKAAPCG